MKCAIQKAEEIENTNKSELSSLLNGIIDSAVNGGTSKYVEAFLVESYLKEFPQNESKVKLLKNSLSSQYNLTLKGLSVHEIDLNEQFYGLHLKMVQMFEKVKTLVESTVSIFE